MNQLAAQTMKRVYLGDARGIRQSEDTITNTVLLDLNIAEPQLLVHRFNQVEEHKVGADWEWFIGSDVKGWFGLRIQAKRATDRQYRQLGHPGYKNDVFQYDTLIRSCQESTMYGGFTFFPFYVFFNGLVSWPGDATWSGCPNAKPLDECSHADLENFGCSAAPAVVVRWVHGGLKSIQSRRIGPHLSTHVPWSWLFGPPPSPSKGGSPQGSAGQVSGMPRTPTILAWHQAIARVAAGMSDETGGLFGPQWLDTFWRSAISAFNESPSQTEGLSNTLPEYAQWVRNRGQVSPEEYEPLSPYAFDSLAPRRIVISDLGEIDQPSGKTRVEQ